jgi:hypothetical protein
MFGIDIFAVLVLDCAYNLMESHHEICFIARIWYALLLLESNGWIYSGDRKTGHPNIRTIRFADN